MKFCAIIFAVACNFIFTAVSKPTDSPKFSLNEWNVRRVNASSNSKSKEELDCRGGYSYFTMGKCYTLGTRGPCGKNELLLDAAPTDDEESEEPKCQPNPCERENEVWWPKSGKCLNETWILSNDCKGQHKVIVLDRNGNGWCRCNGTSPFLKTISAETFDCDKYYKNPGSFVRLNSAIGGYRLIYLTDENNKRREEIGIESDEDDDGPKYLPLLQKKKRPKQKSE